MSEIAKLTSSALRLFSLLCAELGKAKAGHLEVMPSATVENEKGRFKVWCGNLGAMQKGHSSLDFRLRESAIMQSNVTKLLHQLESTLKESKFHHKGSGYPVRCSI